MLQSYGSVLATWGLAFAALVAGFLLIASIFRPKMIAPGLAMITTVGGVIIAIAFASQAGWGFRLGFCMPSGLILAAGATALVGRKSPAAWIIAVVLAIVALVLMVFSLGAN